MARRSGSSSQRYAEHYAHTEPESALVKLSNFAERLVDHLYLKLKLERVPQSNFVDLLHNASFKAIAQGAQGTGRQRMGCRRPERLDFTPGADDRYAHRHC